jgi:quercetin dioxygenase-like cupin family protein
MWVDPDPDGWNVRIECSEVESDLHAFPSGKAPGANSDREASIGLLFYALFTLYPIVRFPICLTAQLPRETRVRRRKEFLAMSQEQNDALKPVKLGDLVSYQSGSVVSRVILKQKGGNVTVFAFDAGQELSEHTAPFDALVNVLEGDVEVTISSVPIRVGAGASILMPANQPHALKAISRFKMVLTMIRG